MATSRTRPALDNEPLSDVDRAASDCARAAPGICLRIDAFIALVALGGDDEVRDLVAAGRIAEAIAVATFNAFEREHPFAQRDQIARQHGASLLCWRSRFDSGSASTVPPRG